MKKCILFMVIVVLSFAFVLMAPISSIAKTVYKIKISHPDTSKTATHLGFLLFRLLAEVRSDGRLEVSIYPSGQLGTQRESIEAAQMGAIEIVNTTSGIATAFVPELSVLDIPFQFKNYAVARAVISSPNLGGYLEDAYKKYNLVLLGNMEQGFRHVSNNKRPITKLEDFKGLKIRTMEAPMHLLNFKALGASPTPMAWGEVFTSLQQGIIDGQENPFWALTIEKLAEVQKYLSVTKHMYDVLPVMACKKWFHSLPKDLQYIILKSMSEACTYQWQINMQIIDSALKELQDNPKVEVNTIPEKELKLMQEVGRKAVMQALYKKLPKDKVDFWIKTVDEYATKYSNYLK